MKRSTAAFLLLFMVLAAGAQAKKARDPLLAAVLQDTGGRQFVTDRYGPRRNPMGGGLAGSFHNGDDLATRVGTPVLSVASGMVIICATGDRTYGRYMVIRDPSGLDFKYGHLKESWYSRGQFVEEGAVIGLSGNTGTSTGPHTHVEITMDLSRYLTDRSLSRSAAVADAARALDGYLRSRELTR